MFYRVFTHPTAPFCAMQRYAHQARSILNEAKVNEDPNIALIRQLRAEIEAYRAQYGEARGTHVAMAVVEVSQSVKSVNLS